MPGAYADRVKETTTTSGTGTVTLAGAAAGFQAFSATFTAATTMVRYCIVDGVAWEVGDGLYTLSGTTLSRLTVYASSNANALVNLSGNANTIVFCDLAAQCVADVGLASGFTMHMVLQ